MSKAKVAGASAAVLILAAGLIAKWEGVRYTPYKDPVGIWTVCYGSTHNVNPDRTYTRAECRERLEFDMRAAADVVQKCVAREMPESVYVALISLTFNVGPNAVCNGTPGRQAREGNWRAACKAIDLYKYAGGRVFRGLVLRRADERKVCERGLQ